MIIITSIVSTYVYIGMYSTTLDIPYVVGDFS